VASFLGCNSSHFFHPKLVADRFCWPLSRASLTPHKIMASSVTSFSMVFGKKLDMIYDDDK
jgi:hypothetical protein